MPLYKNMYIDDLLKETNQTEKNISSENANFVGGLCQVKCDWTLRTWD